MSSSHAGLRGLPQLTGVIFAGRNGLDFLELRLGVFRIPEVSLRVREAQRILDSLSVERVDLMGSLLIDDDAFFRNLKMKSLLAAIVQVGLFDRLLKTQRLPEVLVGNSTGDSALFVCAGKISFEEMVRSSSVLSTLRQREVVEAAPSNLGVLITPTSGLPIGLAQPLNRPQEENNVTSLPALSGANLTEYRAFHRGDIGEYTELGLPVMELTKLLTEIIEHQRIERFINIGPGETIGPSDCNHMAEAAGTDEVTVMDSIDLDPMLNWFWREMRPVVGLAQ